MIDTPFALAALSIHLPVGIRHAQERDLPRLEWDAEAWSLRTLFRQTFEESLTGRRAMLVADCQGWPVGRLFMQLAPSHTDYADGYTRAYLFSLHVLAPFRGHGIGSHLIRAAEQVACSRGFRLTTIAVAQENLRARSLYERLGYRIFRQDQSSWRYHDPNGQEHHIQETCWVLSRQLDCRPPFSPIDEGALS